MGSVTKLKPVRLGGVYRMKSGDGFVLVFGRTPDGAGIVARKVMITLEPDQPVVVLETQLEEISAETSD